MSDHRRNSKTHKIKDISYSEDWLLCICGWEGKAYDFIGLRAHQKEAAPYEGEMIEVLYNGKFNRTIIPRDASELGILH